MWWIWIITTLFNINNELLEPEYESVFCPKCEIGHRRKNNAFLIVIEFPSSYCYVKCYATSASANWMTAVEEDYENEMAASCKM